MYVLQAILIVLKLFLNSDAACLSWEIGRADIWIDLPISWWIILVPSYLMLARFLFVVVSSWEKN